MEDQVNQNTKDINEIKSTLETIKNNHLWHLERDVARIDKTLDKMDNRMWWVLGLLVASIVIGYLGDKF